MTAPIANTINAFVLVLCSGWAYLLPDAKSMTVLIPGVAGVILILCTPGVRTENKIVAHVAVLVTLLIFLALFVPLRSAISSGDAMGMFRVGLMMATSLLAMVFFIKSFRDARKARAG